MLAHAPALDLDLGPELHPVASPDAVAPDSSAHLSQQQYRPDRPAGPDAASSSSSSSARLVAEPAMSALSAATNPHSPLLALDSASSDQHHQNQNQYQHHPHHQHSQYQHQHNHGQQSQHAHEMASLVPHSFRSYQSQSYLYPQQQSAPAVVAADRSDHPYSSQLALAEPLSSLIHGDSAVSSTSQPQSSSSSSAPAHSQMSFGFGTASSSASTSYQPCSSGSMLLYPAQAPLDFGHPRALHQQQHQHHQHLPSISAQSAFRDHYPSTPSSFAGRQTVSSRSGYDAHDHQPALSSLGTANPMAAAGSYMYGGGAGTSSLGVSVAGSSLQHGQSYIPSTPLADHHHQHHPAQAQTQAGSEGQSSPALEHAGSPNFHHITHLSTITSEDGLDVFPHIDCNIIKGFFQSDHNWTCYRRNYFAVQCAFSLSPHRPHLQLYVKDKNNQRRLVHSFGISLSATISGPTTKPIDLIQHTPKRDKGPQNPVQVIQLLPVSQIKGPDAHQHQHHQHHQHHQATASAGSSLGLSTGYLSYQPDGSGSIGVENGGYRAVNLSGVTSSGATNGVAFSGQQQQQQQQQQTGSGSGTNNQIQDSHTFERIQFRKATENNGKRRAQQQYFHLAVDLYVNIADPSSKPTPTWVKVAERLSDLLIVRGRSPSHYRKEGQQSQGRRSTGAGVGGAAAASTRVGPTMPGLRTSSDLSGVDVGVLSDGYLTDTPGRPGTAFGSSGGSGGQTMSPTSYIGGGTDSTGTGTGSSAYNSPASYGAASHGSGGGGIVGRLGFGFAHGHGHGHGYGHAGGSHGHGHGHTSHPHSAAAAAVAAAGLFLDPAGAGKDDELAVAAAAGVGRGVSMGRGGVGAGPHFYSSSPAGSMGPSSQGALQYGGHGYGQQQQQQSPLTPPEQHHGGAGGAAGGRVDPPIYQFYTLPVEDGATDPDLK